MGASKETISAFSRNKGRYKLGAIGAILVLATLACLFSLIMTASTVLKTEPRESRPCVTSLRRADNSCWDGTALLEVHHAEFNQCKLPERTRIDFPKIIDWRSQEAMGAMGGKHVVIGAAGGGKGVGLFARKAFRKDEVIYTAETMLTLCPWKISVLTPAGLRNITCSKHGSTILKDGEAIPCIRGEKCKKNEKENDLSTQCDKFNPKYKKKNGKRERCRGPDGKRCGWMEFSMFDAFVNHADHPTAYYGSKSLVNYSYYDTVAHKMLADPAMLHLREVVYATHDIEAGEEITANYKTFEDEDEFDNDWEDDAEDDNDTDDAADNAAGNRGGKGEQGKGKRGKGKGRGRGKGKRMMRMVVE